MMSTGTSTAKSKITKSTASKAGAGVAGAGGGTLLIVVAKLLPEGHFLKSILPLAAPSIAVTLSALWLWLQVEIINYWRDKRLKTLAMRAKLLLEEALKNPNTTEKHREMIRAKLEELEILITERELSRIKALSAVVALDLGPDV